MAALLPVVVDLNKNDKLNESFLTMFGSTVKEVLRRMFGRVPSIDELETALTEEADAEADTSPNKYNVKIKGSKPDVKAFLGALVAEKDYMQTYMDFGVEDDRTREAKYNLDEKVQDFEETTGLIWPFK